MEAGVLQEGQATFSIDLHPAYSSNPLEGIKILLDPRLLRWDNDLNGILLAYKGIQQLPTQAAIRPYFPYIHLKIRADVLVFRPRVNSVLCGKVTKIGADFIGMTILGNINAAIGRQHIREDLRYDWKRDAWASSKDSSADIEVGKAVIFKVHGLCIEKNGVCAILGSLEEPWTGAVQAAALTRPEAFDNPHRWQSFAAEAEILPEAEPLAAAGSVLEGSLPEAIGNQADDSARPAAAPAKGVVLGRELERSTKKAKRKDRQEAQTELPGSPHAPAAAMPTTASDPVSAKAKKRKRASPASDLAVDGMTQHDSVPSSAKKKKKKDRTVSNAAQEDEAQLNHAAAIARTVESDVKESSPRKKEKKKDREGRDSAEEELRAERRNSATPPQASSIHIDAAIGTEYEKKGKKKGKVAKGTQLEEPLASGGRDSREFEALDRKSKEGQKGEKGKVNAQPLSTNLPNGTSLKHAKIKISESGAEKVKVKAKKKKGKKRLAETQLD